MTSKSPLNLPPITKELKVITPYLQRAEEIKSQEPIVAYWCAYYAAQVGIGLKARDTPSRELLLALLGLLERMKTEIGPNDAVDVDAAGAAYVENFAIKIFVLADNEDRDGRATRATAKKFVAAANFLEVLKTFPKAEVSDSIAEKVRYAKWKAADIAKAFREGRKPLAGPPGGEETSIEDLPTSFPAVSSSPPKATSARLTPPHSPPRNPRTLPPSPPRRPSASINVSTIDDNWSTIATPGTEMNTSVNINHGPACSSPPTSSHKRSNSAGSSKSSSGRRSPRRNPAADDDFIRGHIRTPSPPATPGRQSPARPSGSKPPSLRSQSNSPVYQKEVRFTPSVVGGSVTTSSTPTSPAYYTTHVERAPTPPWQPPPPPVPQVRPSYQTRPPAPIAPVELTPGLISKAQKHCRFAISALDYEDAETAKKELRAALAMLGG